MSADVGDPYVGFLLMLLRRIPPEPRVAWMAEWMPRTSVLLGLHAAEWLVATREVAS